ncbi:MAG: hypothetical protein K6G60_01355 [Lachnospiraceae bacterium]|nr:hypothetical protein [Lachnospiraceae bacterium]
MKIDSSNVSMSSTRSYYSYEKVEQESLTVLSSRAATIELSDDSKNLAEQLREKKAEIAEEEKEAAKAKEKEQKENLKKSLEDMVKANKAHKADLELPTEDDGEIQMLRRILELLKKIRGEKGTPVYLNDCMKSFAESMNKAQENLAAFAGNMACNLSGAGATVSAPVQANPGQHTVNMTNWTKITVQSAFYMETEATAYRSTGSVKTEDGREISFDLTVEMSRSFTAEYGSMMAESYTMVDPLVINTDGGLSELKDRTFLFDLDGDGKEERIHDLRDGAGFLALDKNGDGKINDGNELFGTKSGDGFKDLAAYDDDGNGWIDENDKIFKKLKIWTKDEKGNDVLLDLKKADVGAIYLGSAKTDFSLKSINNNATMGAVRRTGFFLKESTGQAGVVQHVDLAV